MTRIGLISDTHGYIDPSVAKHFANCHEIWHAGDFGNASIACERESSEAAPGILEVVPVCSAIS